MKRLDEVVHLRAELDEESRKATLIIMAEGQIRALEKLLESNAAAVKDPGAWNTVCGFVDQLKFWVPRLYSTVEQNANWLGENREAYPPHPLFGKD